MHSLCIGIKQDHAFSQFQNEQRLRLWNLENANALEAHSKARFNDLRELLVHASTTHQKVGASLEDIYLIYPPRKSNKLFWFKLMDLGDLSSFIDIELIELEKNFLRYLEAFVI